MGNNPPHGIPKMILKNWTPINEAPNTYKNKLTGQLAHKHIVVVDEPQQIQSFRFRMKENNQSICRILFYHHYCDNIYHVYTDQMFPCNLSFSKPAQWNQEKLKIVEAFEQLMKIYKPMRICQQMIGMDSSGKVKVWININPVSPHPWNSCNHEKQMISDLVVCLEKLGSSIQANQSGSNSMVKELNSFKDIAKDLSEANTPPAQQNSCTSTFVDHATTNFNININIGLDKEKKNIHKLQKIFNPVLCETSRNENETEFQMKSKTSKAAQRKQISLQAKISKSPRKTNRPMTNHNQFHLPITSHSTSKHIHSAHFKNPFLSMRNDEKKNKIPSPKKVEKSKNYNRYLKNIFGNQKTQKSIITETNRPMTNYYNRSIPNFLATKNYKKQERAKTQLPVNHHSSTQRPDAGGKTGEEGPPTIDYYIENFDEVVKKRKQMEEKKATKSKNKEENNNNGTSKELIEDVEKITLKEQINNLLESEDEPVSPEYQEFKKFSLYRQKDKFLEQDETELIKEKVQKKKATFADLKMEALKILQDDF